MNYSQLYATKSTKDLLLSLWSCTYVATYVMGTQLKHLAIASLFFITIRGVDSTCKKFFATHKFIPIK